MCLQILKIHTYNYGLWFEVAGETATYICDYNALKGWLCDCPDYTFRKHACKHIRYCIDYMASRYQVCLPDHVYVSDPKADLTLYDVTVVEAEL